LTLITLRQLARLFSVSGRASGWIVRVADVTARSRTPALPRLLPALTVP
jgi:hypothetical protein